MLNIDLLKESINEKINNNFVNEKIVSVIKQNQSNKIINQSSIKKNIQNILGKNFKYKWIFGEDDKKDKDKILSFEFINIENIPNKKKSQYITEKINQLFLSGFVEANDLKISGVGRFIIIELKTIEDYKEDKKILEKEYFDKLEKINHKISIIKDKNNFL